MYTERSGPIIQGLLSMDKEVPILVYRQGFLGPIWKRNNLNHEYHVSVTTTDVWTIFLHS